MRVLIDTEAGMVTVGTSGSTQMYRLDSPEGFEAVSAAWLRAGWDTKYVYSFTWLGRPVIQLPEDLLRLQEVIYQIKPAVIIETGVAHGGSLVFHASLMKALDIQGQVIGIDIEIRKHNRVALEGHELANYITLIEADSTGPEVVSKVKSIVGDADPVLVILDSNHSASHVLGELRAYAPLVTRGSYIVACDGIMSQLTGAPRTGVDWDWNNPITAIDEFLRDHSEFEGREPEWLFNEGTTRARVTYWPKAFLRRIR